MCIRDRIWCIEHADSGEEVVDCLAESLAIAEVCSWRGKGWSDQS